MRRTQVFILRLVIDPDIPRRLHGSLEPVPEGTARSFSSQRGLLNLLQEAYQLPEEEQVSAQGQPEAQDDPFEP